MEIMGGGKDDLDAAELAHEIANALTAIRGWAALARERPDQVERALELIALSAAAAWPRAKALAGQRRLETDDAPVDVGATTDDAVRGLEPLAASRGVKIDCDLAAELVAGPPDDLWSVLVNLLKNAVEAARTQVQVDVGGVGHSVRIAIADDGPGMSAAERERAFDSGVTTKPDGSGLGLPLVRRVIEARGGRVALEARPEGGVRAVVFLPRITSAMPARRRSGVRGRLRPVSGAQKRGPLTDRTVLVVEDDAAVRELLETVLALRGAIVTGAASAAAARRLVGKFDLAIVDFNLGDERGDRLLGELRTAGRVGGALLASGSAPPADVDPRAGPAAWVRKPFVVEEVVAAATAALVARPARAGAR